MDTSNPVMSADRRTIEEILESQKKRRRQDLAYLRDVAMTAERHILPLEDSELLEESEVKAICKEFVATIPVVPSNKGSDIPSVLVEKHEDMPVSGLLTTAGIPIHPPSVNNSQGKVSVNRVMGGSPPAPFGLRSLVKVIGVKALEREHVYTHGTWSGLCVRLEEQMGRKTVSLHDAYKKYLNFSSTKALMKDLDGLFPRQAGSEWPDLEEDLQEHLSKIKVTSASSAGAPYWRNKGDCMQEIIDDVLPLVCKAIKTNKLDELYKNNPELFLCEVKNKLDRYEVSKLETKTRPYCCIPAHWAFLFSCLCQRFQDGLKTFDRDASSCNAYGFSAPNGGLERMYDWMENSEKPRFAVYGDDTCLVVPTAEGVYRVDPDFKQMDGSLHQADIKLCVDWMVQVVAREDGKDKVPPFWAAVSQQWTEMASNPLMIVDGKKIYKKATPTGMISGVPGTTMFDTVKSALAWNLYLQVSQIKGKNLLDFVWADTFMTSLGLKIKEGTWAPALIPPKVIGNLLTDHKFLGVQMLVEEYRGKPIIVPTIPESEAISMLVVQKDNPREKRTSETTIKRRLFDRCRGLMLTVGFSSPLVRDAIRTVVNDLDPVALLMCVNLGTGERPNHIMLEDYAYPDSSGFPSMEYCKHLYSSEEGELEAGWVQLYPTLVPVLQNLRTERREVELVLKQARPVVVEMSTQTEIEPHQEFSVLSVAPKCLPVKQPVTDTKPNVRSQITDREGKQRKVVPTLGESVRTLLASTPVEKVSSISHRMACSGKQVQTACQEYGVFCTGQEPEDLCSLNPIQTPMATQQSNNYSQTKLKSEIISKKQKFQRSMMSRVELTGEQRPDMWVNEEDVATLSGHFECGKDAITSLELYLKSQATIADLRWRTTANVSGQPNPVHVVLEVSPKGDSKRHVMAEVHSINRKQCQLYVARYITELYGNPLVDEFTHKMDDPVLIDDWSEAVEAELANVVVKPLPVSNETKLLSYIRELVGFVSSQGQDYKTAARIVYRSALESDNPIIKQLGEFARHPVQCVALLGAYTLYGGEEVSGLTPMQLLTHKVFLSEPDWERMEVIAVEFQKELVLDGKAVWDCADFSDSDASESEEPEPSPDEVSAEQPEEAHESCAPPPLGATNKESSPRPKKIKRRAPQPPTLPETPPPSEEEVVEARPRTKRKRKDRNARSNNVIDTLAIDLNSLAPPIRVGQRGRYPTRVTPPAAFRDPVPAHDRHKFRGPSHKCKECAYERLQHAPSKARHAKCAFKGAQYKCMECNPKTKSQSGPPKN